MRPPVVKMSLANPGWRRAGNDSSPTTALSWMIEEVRCPVADRRKSDDRRLPMSLHPPPCDVMPEQTIQVARAAFPTGNPSRRRRDALGPI
jgi:hypothetical protein